MDFPIHGSPERSIKLHGTIHPPKTVSNSVDLLVFRLIWKFPSLRSLSVTRAVPRDFFAFFPPHEDWFSSISSVFHSEQCGHFPAHFKKLCLQALHLYILPNQKIKKLYPSIEITFFAAMQYSDFYHSCRSYYSVIGFFETLFEDFMHHPLHHVLALEFRS